jgi:hypothetical protein
MPIADRFVATAFGVVPSAFNASVSPSSVKG